MAARKRQKSRGCLFKVVKYSLIIAIALLVEVILFPDNDILNDEDLNNREEYSAPLVDCDFEYVWAYRHKKGQTYYGYSPLLNSIVSVSVRSGRAQSYHVTKTEGDMQSGLYELNAETGTKSNKYFIYQNGDVWEMLPNGDHITKYRQSSATKYEFRRYLG